MSCHNTSSANIIGLGSFDYAQSNFAGGLAMQSARCRMLAARRQECTSGCIGGPWLDCDTKGRWQLGIIVPSSITPGSSQRGSFISVKMVRLITFPPAMQQQAPEQCLAAEVYVSTPMPIDHRSHRSAEGARKKRALPDPAYDQQKSLRNRSPSLPC
jgi:hypothetical protein